MHLINKIFNNETIRTIWDKDEEKYYISIVDIVGAISKSNRPRKYWSDLKSNLIKDGFEVSEKIGQLKLKSQDGKYRMTDVCDIEGMFRIIGLKENIKVAKMGGHAAKVARDDIEKNLGESVVTKTNKLNYEYIEEKETKKISDKKEE